MASYGNSPEWYRTKYESELEGFGRFNNPVAEEYRRSGQIVIDDPRTRKYLYTSLKKSKNLPWLDMVYYLFMSTLLVGIVAFIFAFVTGVPAMVYYDPSYKPKNQGELRTRLVLKNLGITSFVFLGISAIVAPITGWLYFAQHNKLNAEIDSDLAKTLSQAEYLTPEARARRREQDLSTL
jgi:hypothetical protein